MSHFNVENTARITPAALAAAQDTVQGQELVPDFGEIENPYDFFYCPEAIYVP